MQEIKEKEFRKISDDFSIPIDRNTPLEDPSFLQKSPLPSHYDNTDFK